MKKIIIISALVVVFFCYSYSMSSGNRISVNNQTSIVDAPLYPCAIYAFKDNSVETYFNSKGANTIRILLYESDGSSNSYYAIVVEDGMRNIEDEGIRVDVKKNPKYDWRKRGKHRIRHHVGFEYYVTYKKVDYYFNLIRDDD